MLACAHTDEATGGCVLEIIVLRKQGHNLGEDRFAHQLSILVFGHNAGPHLDLLTNLRSYSRTGAHSHLGN